MKRSWQTAPPAFVPNSLESGTLMLLKGRLTMSRSVLVLLGFYFLSYLPGLQSIICYGCMDSMDPTGRCLNNTKDKEVTCPVGVQTCVISTGIRQKSPNSTKLEPHMTRRCSQPIEASKDLSEHAAFGKGQKMLCYLLTRPMHYGMVDRRCVCAEDKCNYKFWNDLMVHPVIFDNHTADVSPMVPDLGDNALEKVLEATLPPAIPNENMTDQKNVEEKEGSGGKTSVQTTFRTTTLFVETTTNSTAAESGGSSAGLIAGLTVGGVSLAGLAGAAVWWFMFRKPKKKSSKPAK